MKMDNDSVLRFYTDESVNVARESIGENSTPNRSGANPTPITL
ncbi:MAG: hypothetical protein ACLR56_01590 [Oscillospiraceae bacterium]